MTLVTNSAWISLHMSLNYGAKDMSCTMTVDFPHKMNFQDIVFVLCLVFNDLSIRLAGDKFDLRQLEPEKSQNT